MIKHNCMFGMCMCFLFYFKVMKRMLFYWRREKKKEKEIREKKKVVGPEKERKKKFSLVNWVYDFQLIYKKITKNVIWKLKIGIMSFQNTYFKHPKLRVVIQTLLIKRNKNKN